MLAAFLAWAGRRGHTTRGLQAAPESGRTPRLATAQQDLYAAARRCLTDHTLPTGRRLAAALVLLYGQPLARISTLQTDDLQLAADGTTTLGLGPTPVTLLPPLDEIARHAAATAAQQVSRTA